MQHNLALLQDRLLRAIDPASARGVDPPFGIVNILPEGATSQGQQQQQQTSATSSRSGIRGSSTAAKPVSPRGYNTMSGAGNFQTASTSTANYYNPALSNKYPAYSTTPAVPTYDSTGYPSPSYSQPSFTPNQPYTSQPGIYNPVNYQPTPAPQPNVFNPVNPTGPNTAAPYTPPAPTPQQPAMYSYQDRPAETAWNDPPIVQEKPKPAANYTNNTVPNLFTPQPMVNAADRGPPGAPAYQGLYNPMEHQAPQPPFQSPPSFGGLNQNNQVSQATGLSASQAPAPEPPKPVEKGPIPTEHQALQDVFDKLVKSCAQVAPNAQMKRKLEDVARKLEILYDKLRGNLLSQTVVVGLHQIVQAIQQYDYGTGLNVYTGMVSHGNFSEISNFMPAIKVLLQSASQMQVYVQ
ncbi:transport protein sec31a [Plakobranchus ocellatus]|uniref:Transport protein sec31a n=1 Tax=Plakobranchus ocellatus TaxID=259542 RepID=A0AAV4D2W6_9GAST|nr:transport protein sec31a [Plakobranchus ocellatus]